MPPLYLIIQKPDCPVVVDPVPATTSAQAPISVCACDPADCTLNTVYGSSYIYAFMSVATVLDASIVNKHKIHH